MQKQQSVTDRRTDLLTNTVTYRDANVVYDSLNTQIYASLPLNSVKTQKKTKWDRPTDRPTDRHSDLLSRVHATKNSNFFKLKFNLVIFKQGSMKLDTHVLCELLNPTILLVFGLAIQKSVL